MINSSCAVVSSKLASTNTALTHKIDLAVLAGEGDNSTHSLSLTGTTGPPVDLRDPGLPHTRADKLESRRGEVYSVYNTNTGDTV